MFPADGPAPPATPPAETFAVTASYDGAPWARDPSGDFVIMIIVVAEL